MAMTQRALDLARELGLTDNGVHFNENWVPYEARGAWLLEADIGVSAHFDDLETRFAYRTRLLDCFWAGLPVVTTGGDSLGRLVAERGLGRVVPAEDVGAWSDAVASLLDDEEALADVQSRLQAVRNELAWPRVVEPLVRLLQDPPRKSGRVVDTTLAAYGARRLDYALASRGIAGTARRIAAIARERIGHVPGAGDPDGSLPSGGPTDSDD
jgi:hypothetical protein